MSPTNNFSFQVETFKIALNNLDNNGATLDFFWENIIVSFSIYALTITKLIFNIEKTLKNNPSYQDY